MGSSQEQWRTTYNQVCLSQCTVSESIKVLIIIRVTVRDNVQATNVSSGLALNNISVFTQEIWIF